MDARNAKGILRRTSPAATATGIMPILSTRLRCAALYSRRVTIKQSTS